MDVYQSLVDDLIETIKTCEKIDNERGLRVLASVARIRRLDQAARYDITHVQKCPEGGYFACGKLHVLGESIASHSDGRTAREAIFAGMASAIVELSSEGMAEWIEKDPRAWVRVADPVDWELVAN